MFLFIYFLQPSKTFKKNNQQQNKIHNHHHQHIHPMKPSSVEVESSWLFLVGTTIGILGGVLILFFCFCRGGIAFLWGGSHRGQVKRDAVLLLGLPYSGKTALFSQLTFGGVLASTCTSMTSNEGYVVYPAEEVIFLSSSSPSISPLTKEEDGGEGNRGGLQAAFSHPTAYYYAHPEGSAAEKEKEQAQREAAREKKHTTTDPIHKSTLLIDHPGHRRLFPSLLRSLRRACHVVLVVDSITLHDDRDDGVAAIAELLYRTIQSPEFYGVQSMLIACTKRDECTSYSSKAVRKLLEAAITTCIHSRRGELGKVEQVIDGKGEVVKRLSDDRHARKGDGTHHVLSLGGEGGKEEEEDEEDKTFSFHASSFPIPVFFADISSVDSLNQAIWRSVHDNKEKTSGSAGGASNEKERKSSHGGQRLDNGEKVDVEGFSVLPVLRYLVEQT